MKELNDKAIQVEHLRTQIIEAKGNGTPYTKIQKLQQELDRIISNV